MTGEGLVASLVWAAVAAYATWRADLRVAQALAARTPNGEAVAPQPAGKPARGQVQLPDDLEAYVNMWGDEFARVDERNTLRDKYLELHTGDAHETWQRVRTAIGIGQLP